MRAGAEDSTRIIARNALANWAWYAFVLVSGFLLPRLIDRHQGRELLGVWDFGWSMVAYVNLLAMGVSSSVNRYVARYRTEGRDHALNLTVNSALAILVVSASVGVAIAGLVVTWLPHLLGELDPGVIRAARWTVALLCLNCALKLPGGVFNGIITGLERFDRLNAIRIVRDATVLCSSIFALFAGGGIVALAAIVLCGDLLGELVKILVARRLCRGLHLSWRLCRLATIMEVLSFGGKTLAMGLARGAIYQTSGVFIAIFLGPASLAVFARQRALVMHTMRFVKQYAQVFVPRSSVLQASDDLPALQRTLVQTSKWGMYITMPLMTVTLIMAGPLLRLWMGSDYEAPKALMIMAAGHMLFVPQLGVYSILVGIGRHGLPAWAEIGAAVVSIGLGYVAVGMLNGGLVGAAIAMSLPLAVSGGIVTPLYACRVLDLSVLSYLRRVFPSPIIASIPLAFCLLVSRFIFKESAMRSVCVGVGLGALMTVAIYWRWVLPDMIKIRVRKIWSRPVGDRWPLPSKTT